MSRVVEATGGLCFAPLLEAEEHNHMAVSAAEPDPATPWHPLFLSAEQNESLVSFGEALIPGSSAARCNRVIDLILSIESEKNRKEFLAALEAFKVPLEPAQRNELLEKASRSGSPLWPHFELLKEWIADAYWPSQPGLRELGWTGRVAWATSQGCPHPQ
jgi:hypothetical protein